MKKILFYSTLVLLLFSCGKEELQIAKETIHVNEKDEYLTTDPCARKAVKLDDLAPYTSPFSGPTFGELNKFINGCPKKPVNCSSNCTEEIVDLGFIGEYCTHVTTGPFAPPNPFTILDQDFLISQAQNLATNYILNNPCEDACGSEPTYQKTLLELEVTILFPLCTCPISHGGPHNYNRYLWVHGRFNCCLAPVANENDPPPTD